MNMEIVWSIVQIIGLIAGGLVSGAFILISIGTWKTKIPALEKRVDKVEETLEDYHESKTDIAVLKEQLENIDERLTTGFKELKEMFREHFITRPRSTRSRDDDDDE